MKLNQLTISQSAEGLRKKEFSAVELTRACLDRIHERNAIINAFIFVIDDVSIEQARQADDLIAQGSEKCRL